MPSIEEFSNGRLRTFITNLLHEATAAAAAGKLDQLHRIFENPVYRAVEAGTWRPPVADCPDATALTGSAHAFRAALGRENGRFGRFADVCERLLQGHRGRWSADSYLIIPVIDHLQKSGLVYLQARNIDEGHPTVQRRLHVEDLTRDQDILDDFDSLAVVLMKRFYFVSRYPFDPYVPLSGAAYRLMFGCQITEGKSMGAAVLAMFALTFLRERLGDDVFAEMANPQPALITGAIDSEGNVLPVERIGDKVGCAIEEYGPSLRVILPAGSELGALERRIDKGSLFYVSNVDELLTAFLDSANDGAYERCREAVFRRTSKANRALLQRHLAPGIPPTIFDMPATWTEPVARAGGIFSMCLAWQDRLDLSVAPDRLSASRVVAPAEKALVEVCVDGSFEMDQHWANVPELGTSRVATAVFRVKECLDPDLEELVVGILGTAKFIPIDKGANAHDIARLLNAVREEERALYRGSFLRPLREASLRIYADRSKRILLLSDSYIPDVADVPDVRVSFEQRLGFMGMGQSFLFDPDGQLNQRALDLRFRRASITIPCITLDVGSAPPLEIFPAGARVTRAGNSYIVAFEDPHAMLWDIRLRLSGGAPHQVGVSAQVVRGSVSQVSQFPALATRLPLAAIEGGSRSGQLDDEDAALWNSITAGRCGCSRKYVHLYHRQDGTVFPRPVLHHPPADGQYLLLESGNREWVLFNQGCRRDGVFFAVINEKLRWWTARLQEEEVPQDEHEDGMYRLEYGGRTYFIAKP